MVVFARNAVHSVLYLILSFFSAAGIFILLQAEFIAMILVIVYVGAVAVLFLFVVMMIDINTTKKSKFLFKKFIKFTKSLFLILSFILLYISLFLILNIGIIYVFKSFDILIEEINGRFFLVVFTGILMALLMPRRIYKWLTSVIIDLRQNISAIFIVGTVMFMELILAAVSFKSIKFEENFISSPLPKMLKMNNTKALGNVLYTDYIYLFQIAGLILLVAMIGAIVLTHRRRSDFKRQDISAQLKRTAKDTIELKKISLRKGI